VSSDSTRESRHKATGKQRRRKLRLRTWMSVNLAALAALTFTVLHTWSVATTAGATAASTVSAGVSPGATVKATTTTKAAPVLPTTAQIMALNGTSAKYFGVAYPTIPWQPAASQTLAEHAGGVVPDMAEYFVNWTQTFNPAPVVDAYQQGELPVLSWEPWSGGTSSTTQTVQPAYSLSTIIDGAHDTYITDFAKGVKAVGYPIVLRFAHEMNGDWYPWSETVNGNTAGQFIAAWRHVHDIFQRVGAENVIWDWSPNILRGARAVPLSTFYPGDAYVDWVGLTGYEVYETTAAQVFTETMTQVRQVTSKPVLITETGGQPGTAKAGWTTSFLSWLAGQPGVIGFIWFEYPVSAGPKVNWGFDADAATEQAFQQGIKTLSLVKVPTT
jgi:beta-mannanase